MSCKLLLKGNFQNHFMKIIVCACLWDSFTFSPYVYISYIYSNLKEKTVSLELNVQGCLQLMDICDTNANFM